MEPELAKIAKVENRKATTLQDAGEAIVLRYDKCFG
jgi:hypothetical protein